MLQALLSSTRMDDPVQTIHQWESRVKVYEEQSGDRVSENIKLAVLQKYLCDGELARHLNLQSGRLTTYDLAHKEAINYLRAQQTWTASGSSDPMDLSPLGKGKGGKKGKGKGKGKGDKSAKPKGASTAVSRATTRASAGTPQLRCGRNLFSPTRLVGTPVWKWILRQARENLLK